MEEYRLRVADHGLPGLAGLEVVDAVVVAGGGTGPVGGGGGELLLVLNGTGEFAGGARERFHAPCALVVASAEQVDIFNPGPRELWLIRLRAPDPPPAR